MKRLRRHRIGFDFTPWELTVNLWWWSWEFKHGSRPE